MAKMQDINGMYTPRNISKRGAVIAGIGTILFALFLILTQWKCIPVSTESISLAEISKYPDGRILFLLNNPEYLIASDWEKNVQEDGSCYMIPKRAVLEFDCSWDKNVLNDWQYFDVNEMQSTIGRAPIKACYIGLPNHNPILIYEEGMDLEYVGYAFPRRFGLVLGPYDERLDSFRGHWIIDRSQGAEISIERYIGSGWDEHPELFPDGVPSWIISITGGELLTDKDAISMTYNSVLFSHDGFYSELRHTESGGIEYAWGKSLDSMDDVIRCEAESWLELSQPREEKR